MPTKTRISRALCLAALITAAAHLALGAFLLEGKLALWLMQQTALSALILILLGKPKSFGKIESVTFWTLLAFTAGSVILMLVVPLSGYFLLSTPELTAFLYFNGIFFPVLWCYSIVRFVKSERDLDEAVTAKEKFG